MNLAACFRNDPTARHAARRIDDNTEELATRCDDGVIVVSRVTNARTDDGGLVQTVEPKHILNLEGHIMRFADPIPTPPTSAEVAAHAMRLIKERLAKVGGEDALRKTDGGAAVLQKIVDDAIAEATAPLVKSLEERIAESAARVARLEKSFGL
jgi:hypothetical protein